jgi:hypothetical protein
MPVLPKPPGTVIYPVRPGVYIVADFFMPVGTTGIIFVAALQGLSSAAGPTIFAQSDQDACYVRAGSTLARWGIIYGQFFAFIRQALKWTQADAAAFIGGVTVADIQAWEAGTTPIPRDSWIMLADEICRVDTRPGLEGLALSPDLRPRTIRIFPDIPQKSEQVPYSPPC